MATDKILERKVLQPGEIIFKEGEEGSRAYVVQAGEVEISKTIDDEMVVLGVVGPGGIFGEMALIDDSPRMATARALGVSTVILVSRQMLDEKLAKADPFVRGLLNIFATNLRRLATQHRGNEPAAAPPPPSAAAPAAEAAPSQEAGGPPAADGGQAADAPAPDQGPREEA